MKVSSSAPTATRASPAVMIMSPVTLRLDAAMHAEPGRFLVGAAQQEDVVVDAERDQEDECAV